MEILRMKPQFFFFSFFVPSSPRKVTLKPGNVCTQTAQFTKSHKSTKFSLLEIFSATIVVLHFLSLFPPKHGYFGAREPTTTHQKA